MSWPCTMYYCTACGFEQGDGRTWGNREYVLGSGVRIPVRWRIGWCESCDGLAAIEDLSSKRRMLEYREAQRDLQLEISRTSLSWFFGLSKWERSLRRMYEDNMEDAIDALEMLSNRKSPPHCLSCLSTQVHVPEKRESNGDDAPDSPCVYNASGQAPEKSESANEGNLSEYVLLHPGCGGEIRPRPFDLNGMRLALKQSVHRFTPEGFCIEKEDVAGYSAPDREYCDALSESNRQYRAMRWRVEGGSNFGGIPEFLRKQAD